MGLISSIIFTCLFKQPTTYVLQNRSSATGAVNLKKPVQEFISSKNEGCFNNELIFMHFVFVGPLCQWLSHVNNKHATTM